MSTTTAPSAGPGAVDVDRAGVPFGRLVAVELRKMADTRAGKWMLGAIAALSVIVMVIMLIVLINNDTHVGFRAFLSAMSIPMGILLPVFGVLSITSEWSQRTALVTFTLEPHRGRVLVAKIVAGVVVAVLAVVVAAIAGALGNVILAAVSGDSATWDVNALELLGFFVAQELGLLMGFTFGMLLLSSAAAIVVYFAWAFVIPTIFGAATVFIGWFKHVQPWIDFSSAQTPLFGGGWGDLGWAHLLVSGTIWLLIPFVLGTMRVLRSEIK